MKRQVLGQGPSDGAAARSRLRGVALGLLLLASAASSSSGEAATDEAAARAVDSGVREHVHVSLRQLDFLALDKHDRPVTDLRPDEVRIWENGEEQTVLDLIRGDQAIRASATPESLATPPSESTASSEPGGPPSAANAPIERSVGGADGVERRWIILYFDMNNLGYQNRILMGRAAKELVRDHLSPTDRVALMVDDDSVRIVAPFSSDTGAVLKLLDHVEGLSKRSRDMEHRLEGLRDDAESCREASDIPGCARQAVSSFLMETSRETDTSLDHLEALLQGLAAIPERKILFYFSDGFLTNPGDVALAAVEHAIGQIGYNLSAMASFLRRDSTYRLEKIYQLAADSSTGVYPVNGMRKSTGELFSPTKAMDYGPENPPQARTDAFEATWHQVRRFSQSLARATGGVPVFQRDPGDLLTEQLNSSSGVYTAFYEPTSRALGRRKIKIKVSRPKVRLFYRDRYSPQPIDLVRLDGQLDVTQDGYDRTGTVNAELKVAGGAFTIAPDSEPPVSVASVYFDLRDSRNRSLADLYEVIAFPRGETGAIEVGELKRPFALRLPKGSYMLRVDVHDVHGAAEGSFERSFRVGSPAGSGDDVEGRSPDSAVTPPVETGGKS